MAPPRTTVGVGSAKLKDPLARYVVTAFTYGSGLGATQAAPHMNTVTAHELAAIAKRHCTATNLARAGADVVDAHLDLDLVRAWGDGSVAAVDGTIMDAAVDNLLAETSIRYGGYGGIAHHLVADTYLALFSRFVPCGVWEAVYLIDSLLQNQSAARPGPGPRRHARPVLPSLRTRPSPGDRPAAQDPQLPGPHHLPPPPPRRALPAHRPAVLHRPAHRDRLGVDPPPLARPHAGRPLREARVYQELGVIRLFGLRVDGWAVRPTAVRR